MVKHFNYYEDYDKQTNIKKIIAFFLDALFVIILGLVGAIIIATPIIKGTSQYQNSISVMETTCVECYKIQADAKLSIKKDESSILSEDELYQEYLSAHILLSYTYNQEKYNAASIVIQDTSKKATFDNDLIGYYFATYKKDNNIKVEDYGDKDSKDYFISLITKSNVASYFDLHGSDLPSLTFEVGKDLYNYKNGKTSSSSYSSNLNDFFISTNRKGLVELSTFEPYKVNYDKYVAEYKNVCGQQIAALLLTLLAAFLIVVLLPMVIFGNGLTFGRFLTKTRCVSKKNPIVSTILDLLVYLILLFPSIAIIGIFAFGMNCLNVAIVGSVTLLGFVFVAFIIVIADFIVTSFVPKNVSFIELASMQKMVGVAKKITED